MTVSRVAAAVALLLLAACAGGQRGEGVPSEATAEQRQELEEFARVTLPPSAADVEVVSQSGIDAMLFARFTIAGSDVETFLAEAGVEPADEEASVVSITPPAATGWAEEIDALQRARTAEEFDGAFGRKIVVGLDDPERALVFVLATTV